jgi:hypothetical protein
MADYYGTDDDDLIDASQLPEDFNKASDKIYPGKGNDEIINIDGHEVVSSEGNDSYSGINIKLAYYSDPKSTDINLQKGSVTDGYGGTDTINGHVSEVYLSREGGNFTGTESFEKIIIWGSNNTVITGNGEKDRVQIFNSVSSDYNIQKVGEDIQIKHNTEDIINIINGSALLVFSKDSDQEIFDLDYYSEKPKAVLQKEIYSFTDNTMSPGYEYAGKYTEPMLTKWSPSASSFTLDVDQDGYKEAIFPMMKGYATGIDGTTPFIAFTIKDSELVFDTEINSLMPNTIAARNFDYIKIVGTESLSVVTTNHATDQEAKRNSNSEVPPSELILIQVSGADINRDSIFPKLPFPTSYNANLFEDKYSYAVDAHAQAVGDINGDGLDDIIIGSMWDAPYELVQDLNGKFSINNQDIYTQLRLWPLTNAGAGEGKNIMLSMNLSDVNGDGYDDLITGHGHGSTSSKVFINKDGVFSEDSMINLPDSIYGIDNQMHMKTMANDFDHDGDIDLAIHWSRFEPYYAGNYIQILINDGVGNFSDNTNSIPLNSIRDAYSTRLEWIEHWQLIDANNDDHMDITGSSLTGQPLVYYNDGEGNFEIHEIDHFKGIGLYTVDNNSNSYAVNGKPYIFEDFDQDGLFEYITFQKKYFDDDGNEYFGLDYADATYSRLTFFRYEMNSKIGTGPDYSADTAEKGVPGFNERYYLNENSLAQEALKAGVYDTGLAHYLAEGKDADLKTFAPFTKVHGYSGNDTIVLREGDETAFGYAGKDTIEGGAGNDIIDGGEDLDTAIYKDTSSAYTLTANDDGTVSVVHSSPSEDFTDEGSDTLTSIEKMQFSDKTLSKTSLKYQLSESIDSSENILSAHTEDVLSGTLNFNKGDNIIILDGQGKTYRGLEGDDTYFVSQLLPKNGKVSITDTEGSNLVQLPTNTYIDKSLFTKNAARLTLEDGREITISGADKFSYNVGGNVTDGTKGIDLTFTEFAEVFGVYDILNSSSAQTGTISDMYII